MKKLKSVIPFHDSQLLLFGLVGGFSALINISTFKVILLVLGREYLTLATTVAYVLSVGVHFFGNQRFTFRSNIQDTRSQIKKYLLMVMINYLMTIMIVTLFTQFFLLSPTASLVIAIISTFMLSFLLSRHFVFIKG